MRKTKKLLLLIDEGPTDDTALSKPIENLINSFDMGVKIRCKVCHYDITIKENNDSPSFADPFKVKDRIKDAVKTFLTKNDQFDAKDVLAVCSLHDLDACYCKNEDIIYHNNSVLYDLGNNKLYCKDVINIQNRNDIKQRALGILSTTNKIVVNQTIMPYIPLYYSINLEHILINNPNIRSKDEKIHIAQDFRSLYKNDYKEFMSFLISISVLNNNVNASWNERFLYKYPFTRYSNLIDIVSFVFNCIKGRSFHPGDYLNMIIKKSNISLDDFANKSNIDLNTLLAVLDRKICIDINLAKKLAVATGIDETVWIKLEERYNKVIKEI